MRESAAPGGRMASGTDTGFPAEICSAPKDSVFHQAGGIALLETAVDAGFRTRRALRTWQDDNRKPNAWNESSGNPPVNESSKDLQTCAGCGKTYAATADVCPECGGTGQTDDVIPDEKSEWVRVRDSLKLKWVASVLAFWVSVSVLVVVMLLDNRIDLILTSISLAMLIIGIWLKTRYRLHLRSDPDKP
jgi:hypothetical protein